MIKMILVVGPPLAPKAMALAERRGVRVRTTDADAGAARIAEAASKADALIVRWGKITEAVIAASPALRVIVKHGVGYDNIDLEAAVRRGIPVLVSRGNAQSVAELAFALMFGVARSTAYLDARVRAGCWDKAGYEGMELSGKTLGIVGLGAIGRRLAEMTAPLRMPVRIYSPSLAQDPGLPGAVVVPDLDALLRESDVVSLHCPLTPMTRNLIGARQLDLIGPRGILINTARGGLVDERALAAALTDGRISGAGLDCFEQEPPAKDSPLWSAPNLAVTPHAGGNTSESRERVGLRAVELVLGILEGGAPDAGAIVNAAAPGAS
jgi:D-3-phosphoglycerate dehydrogenase